MVQMWVLLGLITSAVSVSVLGAFFSIVGLGKLFSGAMIAVWLMAAALELSKFTLAAYLHQVWLRINFLLKFYMVSAIVILSIITSMGIFGFLSDAYQESSVVLEAEQIKLDALLTEKKRNEDEVARINKAIDEIPADRITRKMMARDEYAPILTDLSQQSAEIAKRLTDANLKILEVKDKVGPLIYISRAFKIDIDTIVKYLVMLFVFVFDPLAICLIIAVSNSLKERNLIKSGYHPGEERLAKAAQSLKMRFAANAKGDKKDSG
jgi:hypothetical protein